MKLYAGHTTGLPAVTVELIVHAVGFAGAFHDTVWVVGAGGTKAPPQVTPHVYVYDPAGDTLAIN